MDRDTVGTTTAERWARLKFVVIGELLERPPKRGELAERLRALSERSWSHPSRSGESVRFAPATIETWYYTARRSDDPIAVLRPKVRKDAGTHPSLPESLREVLHAHYREHPSWTYQLHADNLEAAAEQDDELPPAPSYSVVRRYMKEHGLVRRKKKKAGADSRVHERREQRSYEAAHVHELWHADFHKGSRKVLCPDGKWRDAKLFAAVDDRSRLCCHLQWYLDETAESFVHGLCQALQKRGRPRRLMTDNGSAMKAAETGEGLSQLSITHDLTLPYSPEHNAKVEVFWAQLESRLMAMLEGVPDLDLRLLNEATLAWAEMEYNRKRHSEIGCAPLRRLLDERDVGRPCPSSETLRSAFRQKVMRTQRRSDGTVTIEGRRYEVPSRYRNVERLCIRYARWDLSVVELYDDRAGKPLCVLHPLDKERNADGRRRTLEPMPSDVPTEPMPPSGVAPLLNKLMGDYAATGLPPAYLPEGLPDTDTETADEMESDR